MDSNIFKFILRHSKREQVYILIITLISFPFVYYSLDLPKQIVNGAIDDGSAKDFPKAIFGYQFDRIEYLLLLSFLFLILVFVNGGFKLYINIYKGKLGERMLRRLRYELYCRILRFPLPHFRKTSQGEMIPMITSEVEPLGGFIGDAFVQPIWSAGTLLVYIYFIFVQDPILGAAAVSLYPLQGWLIPRLQKRVNQLGKERVRTVRKLADRIGESVSGITDMHTNDATAVHLADFSDRLGTIYDIRFEIYRLVIRGDIQLGALVAVLAAYKDLAAPWKDLLDYYQTQADTRIKYEQVVEQFQPPELLPVERITGDEVIEGPLPKELTFSAVALVDDSGMTVIEGLTASFPTAGHVAVVGAGVGKDELMLMMARLISPTSGKIRLGEHDYETLSEAVIGRRFAFVGAHSYMFTGTLRQNLYYGLCHRPLQEATYDDDQKRRRARRVSEAQAAGNTDFDINADWIDYKAAGVEGPEALQDRALEILQAVDMEQDVYRIGLNGTIDPDKAPDIADRVLAARVSVRKTLAESDLGDLVELYDADRFNSSASVAENLLFGTPVGPVFAYDALAENEYVLSVLERTGLMEEFIRVGAQMAETMVELFADLPPGHEFFEQFSFIGSEDLPEFQPIVMRAKKEGTAALRPADRTRLLSLPFKLVPSRHRLGVFEADLQQRLLEARKVFAAELPEDLRRFIEFFDAERFNEAASLQDNILFGKIRYGRPDAAERVQALIQTVVDEVELRDSVIAVGLDFSVGVAGSRLSAVQRQKVGLGRALLKNADVLLLNEATSTLDGVAQNRVHRSIRELRDGRGLIWGVHRPSMAREFADIVVVRHGRIVERGDFQTLNRNGSALHELLEAE
ncbi:MAG: ABC transporter ATP-binding protein [Inquilinus limosus]|uniref:ABC transporter ATP-binding protein n=1 Tax=Inquilinus limosus TaxID=171674 RepID=A0A952FG77_9PROT|nr:ABC transporter ATP-binding protein [Inquilinus limosus]